MAQTAQININVNAQSANKTVDQLNKSISSAGGSAASLKAELRKTIQELQNLQPGTKRFQELSVRAGELKDQIADTNAVVGQLAGNVGERLTRGISNVVGIGVAGFQALSAGAALFGVESEDLNQTLVQMGALMNLSQAVETFSSLPDRINEVRASFQSLTVATETQAVAETANAVATEGAAVATGALTTQTTLLGVAMKALPIVAAVAALGTLVYGVYEYVSAGNEAEKQEKRRKKTLEDLKKQEEERVGTIAKESAGYVLLINQLKATNAGSAEREKLIKKINSTYNTTLKNLSDEAAFQKQLNLEVANYIAYQKAKFQLQKNEDLVQANLVKQEGITKKLTAAQRLLRDEEEKSKNFRQDDKTAGDVLIKIQEYTKEVNKLQGELDAANKRLESYGKVNQNNTKIIEEIEGTTGKYNTTLKDNTDKTKDATDANSAYDEILKQIKQTQEENKKQEEELLVKRLEAFNKTEKAIQEQQRIRQEAAVKEFEAVRIQIEKEVTEQNKKQELLRLNEANMTKYFQIEQERRTLDVQVNTLKIIDEYQKRNEYIKAEEKALQKEIRFGDGDTTDTMLSLKKKQLDVDLSYLEERLNASKYQNRIDIEEYERLLNERRDLFREAAEVERQDKMDIARADLLRQQELEKARIEASGVYEVQFKKVKDGQRILTQAIISLKDDELKEISKMDKKAYEDKISLFDKEIDEQQKLVDKSVGTAKYGDELIKLNALKANKDVFDQKVLTATKANEQIISQEKNFNQTIENLNSELATRSSEIYGEYQTTIEAMDKKTTDDIYDYKISKFDDYLSYISNVVSEATNLISQFAAQQTQIATQQLNDQISLDRERIESQYAAALLSREQYDNEIAQLEQKQEQDQLALDRKNFRTEKALSIAGATIDGARAVLGAFAGTQGGIVVRSLAATLAGVFAATQIGLIARQEFRAATGGIVPGTGSGEIDSVPARLAPGEAVINSQSTQAFLPLLSAINEVGGGKSFVPDLPAVNEGQRFAPVFANNGKEKEPIRAYVVESDISSSQKRVNRIERSTKF